MRECHESGQLLTPLPKRAVRAVRYEEKRRGFIIQGKAKCQGGEEGGLSVDEFLYLAAMRACHSSTHVRRKISRSDGQGMNWESMDCDR
jgi:hypothetical protein